MPAVAARAFTGAHQDRAHLGEGIDSTHPHLSCDHAGRARCQHGGPGFTRSGAREDHGRGSKSAGDEITEDYAIDALYTDGNLTSLKAFLKDGTEVPVPAKDRAKVPNKMKNQSAGGSGEVSALDTGGGGAPGQPIMCRAVTVNNHEWSWPLGTLLFTTHVKTDWCWNTYTGSLNVNSTTPSTPFTMDDVVWHYVDMVHVSADYFPYLWGYPQSGHVNDRKFHFASNQPWGTTVHLYPRTELKVYYDGSYTWTTWD